jgi:hypothetical protein
MNLEIVAGVIKKFSIGSVDSLDELCYSLYNMFKDFGASIAVERYTCSKMTIVDRNLEIRFYVSPIGDGVIASFFVLEPATNSKSLIHSLIQLYKMLTKLVTIKETNLVLRCSSALDTTPTFATNLYNTLPKIGIALENVEERTADNIYKLTVIKGFYIGEGLQKRGVLIALISNDTNELSITIETKIDESITLNKQMLENQIAEVHKECREIYTKLLTFT